MKYPVLNQRYALRQIENELYYLMDPITGFYYSLEDNQFEGFKLSDGTRSIDEISKIVDVKTEEVEEFFDEQADSGFVDLYDNPIEKVNIHYVKSKLPHFSDVLVEITGQCNLYCKHCFNSKFNAPEWKQKNMSKDQILSLIQQLNKLNVRRIQLSGGEPLTRDDIWEIIEEIDKNKIFLDVISTNALLINEESAKKFGERFRENGALYISLDGITKNTYEGLRGEGTFEQIMKAFDLLEKENCRVFVNTMAYKNNLHELKDMYDWITKRKNIMGWRIGLPKVLGRYEENHEHLQVGFDEVITIFKDLLTRWISERPPVRLELSDFFRTDCLEIGFEDHQLEDNPCKYAMTNASIKPDGNVVFCASLEVHEPANLGNLVEKGLENVWLGERHRCFRKLRIKDLPQCSECRYVRVCGGGCRSNALLSYGDIKAVDPRACIAMKMLEEEILPLLPEETVDQIKAMINKEKIFTLPTNFVKYI